MRGNRITSLAALLSLSVAGPGLAPAQQAKLVPARFTSQTDTQGGTWDIQSSGHVNRGTTSTFSGAAVLTVNGSGFSPRQSMMTSDGKEYVLSGTCGNILVTRRVQLDLKQGLVRYVDVFENPAAAPVTLNVMLQTSQGNSQAQAVLTDKAAPLAGILGAKDSGIVSYNTSNTNQLSVLFYLCGAGSKLKPSVHNDSNYRYRVTYSVTVPAKKKAALLHGLAQRRLTQPPDAKTLAGLFKPFASSSFRRGIPSDVRRSIVNDRSSGLLSGFDIESYDTLESLNIEPGPTDILAIGERTRIRGSASCNAISLETRFGPFTVPLEKVLAIAGDNGGKRPARLFLRDGQILSGTLAVEALEFTMNTGLVLKLTTGKLDRLVLQSAPGDGRPAAGVSALVETADGDRLALVRDESKYLLATTPWGTRRIGLDELVRLSAPEDGNLGHRLVLRDGSRVFAFLDTATLNLKTQLFDLQQFEPLSLRSITAAAVRSGSLETNPVAPHAVLVGENVLVGQIDQSVVNFLTGGQSIPVPPNQIRILRNISDASEDGILFEAELWDGGVVAGALKQTVLRIRSGDRLADVPVQDLVEIHVPTPTVPDGLRRKIADHIRNLGHPDFEQREAASATLAELGYLARLQLSESLQRTSDPEVRRRIQKLLEELGE